MKNHILKIDYFKHKSSCLKKMHESCYHLLILTLMFVNSLPAVSQINYTNTFSYTGTMQTFTVPSNVTSIVVTATGAQGGNNGGKGASITGTLAVTPGELLQILVGGQGVAVTSSNNSGGGGGGGSFVVREGNIPLIIAGGGGGRCTPYDGFIAAFDPAISGGRTVTSGGTTNSNGGGTSGNGGNFGISDCCLTAEKGASGGGGFYTSGLIGSYGTPGASFVDGGTAGLGGYLLGYTTLGGNGGYGGGAGAAWDNAVRCGGGGGYSGGQGGTFNYPSPPLAYTHGAGGGSYNAGTSPINIADSNSGNAAVTITYISCVNPDSPQLTSTSNNVCLGNPVTLLISSGSLNDATDWFWYTGSCAGSLVGQGTSIIVSPSAETTYYVRGEGGCTTSGACSEITVSVSTPQTYYADADNDGFGNPALSQSDCIQPIGFVADNTDCDDGDETKHATFSFYLDSDGDTFGTGSLILVCAENATTPPVGYAVNNTDCNDANGAINQTYPFFVDGDADGFGFGTAVNLCAENATTPPAGYAVNNTDCNDANASVHMTFTFYVDADADGFGFGTAQQLCAVNATTPPAGYVTNNLDCNDAQVRYQDLDGDLFGSTIKVPCGGRPTSTDCNDNLLTYRDLDGDGYGVNVLVACGVPNRTDCNDNSALVYQSNLLFVDADGDGYTSGQSQTVCYGATIPSGFTAANIGIDCNDNFAAINPGAAEVPYNGIDDDCDLLIDEGFPLLTTSLLPGICNTTLASIGSLIGITTLPSSSLITGYRIRATNGAQVQIIERGAPHFTMQMFGSYNYATTYTIDIELQRNGVWLGYYGPTCQISTPAILAEGGASAVSALQCGITLPKINTLIATTSIQGVTGYRFRITNLTDLVGPNPVQTVTRTLNWFTLQMLTRYNYGTTYRIEVAVKTTGDFGGYGSPCEISSPPSPSLTNCEATIATNNTIIACASLAGVSQYRFQVTRDSDGASTTIDRSSNYFTFSSVPPAIFSAGALYNVRIAVMSLGTWSPFGDICQITAPGLASKQEAVSPEMDQNDFKAVASPNPFTSDFGINLTTSSQENVVIKVYDLLGRLVESTEVKVPDLNYTKVGGQYPAGIYNVIVSQRGIVKVLRLIKR